MADITQSLTSVIADAIKAIVDEEVDRAVETAAVAIRQRVSERLGEIAVSVFQDYSIERLHNALVIRVQNQFSPKVP